MCLNYSSFATIFRKQWLKTIGSPSSRIEKAVFKNEKEIKSYTYDSFKIKRQKWTVIERNS